MSVYLSGGIFGLTEAEAMDWRRDAQEWLGLRGVACEIPVPMPELARDAAPEKIVAHDMELMARSKVMLVKADKPSWATAMEVYHFRAVLQRPVIAWVPQGIANTSAWLRHFSSIQEQQWEQALEATLRWHEG